MLCDFLRTPVVLRSSVCVRNVSTIRNTGDSFLVALQDPVERFVPVWHLCFELSCIGAC